MEWIALLVAIAILVVWIGWKAKLNRQSRERREATFMRRSLETVVPPENKPTPFPTTYPHPERSDTLDFTRLEDLLKDGKYEAADRETLRLLLRAGGVEQRGYLDLDDWEMLSIERLQQIDRLWATYSDGRFGFHVQRQIYRDALEEYSTLGTRVQWVSGGKWFDPDRLNYTSDAPEGHLPLAVWQSVMVSFGFVGLAMCMDVLFARDDWPEIAMGNCGD
ncbi:MAG: GUN4 domain-containing protein [Cyanobacteria bacterium SBC]|nr:GUN4 domain-containing protein [Cyanobacteria bacterium SBC]